MKSSAGPGPGPGRPCSIKPVRTQVLARPIPKSHLGIAVTSNYYVCFSLMLLTLCLFALSLPPLSLRRFSGHA
jgi:hypothetical protein